jgi:hypothetical protein
VTSSVFAISRSRYEYDVMPAERGGVPEKARLLLFASWYVVSCIVKEGLSLGLHEIPENIVDNRRHQALRRQLVTQVLVGTCENAVTGLVNKTDPAG